MMIKGMAIKIENYAKQIWSCFIFGLKTGLRQCDIPYIYDRLCEFMSVQVLPNKNMSKVLRGDFWYKSRGGC